MDLGKTHHSLWSPTSNILFTCEHATDRVPSELGTLGLTQEDLQNCKDLYDPGALPLMQKLASSFNASYVYADLSRLVIDANRYFDAPGKNTNSYHSRLVKKELLTTRDGQEIKISIPHNQHVSEIEERALYEAICVPYQEEMIRLVSELKTIHPHVIVVSVHSFFPSYAGQIRTVDIDVMGYIRPESAEAVATAIRSAHPQYRTAIDEPWSIASADGGALHVLQGMSDMTVFAFDIKNDNLDTDSKIAAVAAALSSGIAALR